MTRILHVYSSLFGANAELARLVEAALEPTGCEVRSRRVREVALAEDVQPSATKDDLATADDLAWADGFIISSPSHTGLLSASIKAFIDENHDAAVAGAYLNTTFTAMATSAFAHAGQERVVDDLNAAGAAWGCVLVPPSTADPTMNKLDGNPYGLSFVLEHGKIPDADTAAEVLSAHLTRFVAVTEALAPLRSADKSAVPPVPPKNIPPSAADVFS
ncbi:NAD(P)H-dependent oxidoreductase [Gordonia sp. HY285]|uniref:flavodoxin family protein n=1 Tax=Gordonia liuliyuniae TaxID=2911517 RepID=UPI001F002579|nr:NAD(P)H-dependent oxidoreductase [Gordonia liuliyuniae]MCF8610508.1 NAD(P)H-dependent oxidoreductase [Gordonia liuliyuniae]